jgi:hypothetical protein
MMVAPLPETFGNLIANLWTNLAARWRAGCADYFFTASRTASLTPPIAF